MNRFRNLADPVCTGKRCLLMRARLRLSVCIHIADRLAVTDIQFQIPRRRIEIFSAGRRYHQYCKIRLSRIVGQDPVRKHFSQSLCRLFCLRGVFFERFHIKFLLCTFLIHERKCSVIFQQDDALSVRSCRGIPVRLFSDRFHRVFRTAVWVFKHAEFKHFLQCACNRAIQRLICQHKLLLCKSVRNRVGLVVIIFSTVVRFHSRFVVEQTADQIHARMADRKSDPFCRIQHFHTPAHVVDDTRIRIDITFESKLFAEHCLDKGTVIGESKRFQFTWISLTVGLRRALFFRRFGIVRHDRGSVIFHRRLKCRNVVFLQ